jgi:hypothetical protein
MVYKQKVLYYRCAATNFEELHNVTVPPTADPAVIAANYAGRKNYRLVKLTTLSGEMIHDFEQPTAPQRGEASLPQSKDRGDR